ncbi:hypothetical protein WP8W18E11_P11010 (plasmid) [Acinetobacter baumannii]|nr:hypothetical protein F922_03822 [Acinetobacter baumannii NIPH 201]BBT51006.1 hypothetical protein WP8W18E11_P11010 [Acinetobacter baumannii]
MNGFPQLTGIVGKQFDAFSVGVLVQNITSGLEWHTLNDCGWQFILDLYIIPSDFRL